MSVVNWVAGGNSTIPTSTIQWSSNGYNWYDASSGGFDNNGNGVAYDSSGVWVTVGSGTNARNSIQWSLNGKDWHDASSGGLSEGYGVAYGNGWVAVGYGSIQWSPDGKAWQDASSGGFGAPGRGVAYSNGQWVAVGGGISRENTILWSPDGRTWHDASSGGFLQEGDCTYYNGNGIAYSGSKWVAVGDGNTPETSIKWSLNGKDWHDASSGGFVGGGGYTSGYGIAYNGTDRWVAVGEGSSPTNSILWSTNGTDWNDASDGFNGGGGGYGIAYDGTRWIAVGAGDSTVSTILWSTDGRTWYDASSGGFLRYGEPNTYSGYSIASTRQLNPNPNPPPLPCFVTGTRILTPTGYKKVEEIESGDLVCTSDTRNVKAKIYRFTIARTTEETAPYTIQAGALGKQMPLRDLHVSGNHAIKNSIGFWQIPKFLAQKNARIQQHAVGKTVTYYHVACENYMRDNLIVEGVTAESYNDSRQPIVWKRNATGYVRRQLIERNDWWRASSCSHADRDTETHNHVECKDILTEPSQPATDYVRHRVIERNDWWRASTCSHAPARTQSVGPVTRSTDRRGPPSRPAAN